MNDVLKVKARVAQGREAPGHFDAAAGVEADRIVAAMDLQAPAVELHFM
jgi:hypothetical protein